ncbi:MAG: hypothetical protein SF029_21875 [bacterium]|nr:hypothetical protein [bacterium]
MPVTVHWDDEIQRTIVYVIDGNWTWEEVFQARAQVNAWLDDMTRKAAFIFDTRTSNGRLPPNALASIRTLIEQAHPNAGPAVFVVNPKTFTRALMIDMLKLVGKLYRARWNFMFANSMEEARALLRVRTAENASV